MKKLVYIDACIRDEESRTKRIALPIIDELKKKYDVTTFVINELKLDIVQKALINKRLSGDIPSYILFADFFLASNIFYFSYINPLLLKNFCIRGFPIVFIFIYSGLKGIFLFTLLSISLNPSSVKYSLALLNCKSPLPIITI